MKKIFYTFTFIVFTFSLLLTSTNAQGVSYKIPNPSKFDSLEELITGVGTLIRPLFLLTFGALILLGAWNLQTSKGNPEKIEAAKKIFISAIIGFSLAVLAPTIASLFTNFLGVDGFDV